MFLPTDFAYWHKFLSRGWIYSGNSFGMWCFTLGKAIMNCAHIHTSVFFHKYYKFCKAMLLSIEKSRIFQSESTLSTNTEDRAQRQTSSEYLSQLCCDKAADPRCAGSL